MKKLGFILLFLIACVYMDNVSQPASVGPNEEFTITITGSFDGTYLYANQGWFAIMLPTSVVIDSIRYQTANGLNELITQLTDTVGKWAGNAFPADPYMGWYGFETQSYNQSSGSTYEAFIYLHTTSSVFPGNYLIDYRTGDRYYNTLRDDSILDQPLEIFSISIAEEKQNTKNNKLEAYPNPFRNRLRISSKKGEIVNIIDKLGKIIKSFCSNENCIWDGRNEKGFRVPAGTYFIQGNNELEKVILLD